MELKIFGMRGNVKVKAFQKKIFKCPRLVQFSQGICAGMKFTKIITSKGRSPCDIVGGVFVEADHSTEVGLRLLRFGLEKDKECITFWPKDRSNIVWIVSLILVCLCYKTRVSSLSCVKVSPHIYWKFELNGGLE